MPLRLAGTIAALDNFEEYDSSFRRPAICLLLAGFLMSVKALAAALVEVLGELHQGRLSIFQKKATFSSAECYLIAMLCSRSKEQAVKRCHLRSKFAGQLLSL